MIGAEAAGAGQPGQGRGGGRRRCLSLQTNRATSGAPSLSASLAASGLLGTARPATESVQRFSFLSSACAVSRELSRPCSAFRPVEAARITVFWRHRVWGRWSCSGRPHKSRPWASPPSRLLPLCPHSWVTHPSALVHRTL